MEPSLPTPASSPSQPVAPMSQPGQLPGKSKKGLIIGIIAGALVVLGALGWWFYTSSQDAYSRGAASYEQKLKEAFNRYKNSKNVEAETKLIRNTFDAALEAKPQEPNLLGIPLGAPAATKQRIDTITTSFKAMRDGFVDLHDFNDFASACLKKLDEIQRLAVFDYDATIKAYNKAAEDILAIKGPAGVNDFKTQKADTLKSIATETEKSKTAYNNLAQHEYEAAEAEITRLKSLITVDTAIQELQKIYRNYYDTLSKDYETTAQLLGING